MIKKYLLTIICALSMSAFATDILNQSTRSETRLLVHKTPTCGCCKQWVKHIKNNGFIVDTKDHQNLEDIKIPTRLNPNTDLVILQYLQMVLFLKVIYLASIKRNF